MNIKLTLIRGFRAAAMQSDNFFLITVSSMIIALGEGAELVKSKSFTIKPLIAGFVVGALLMILAMIDSELGKLFAVLAVIAALLVNGPVVIAAIMERVNNPVSIKPSGQSF